MSDEKDKSTPETPAPPGGEEERTVFMPGGFTLPPGAGDEAEAPPAEPAPEAPAAVEPPPFPEPPPMPESEQVAEEPPAAPIAEMPEPELVAEAPAPEPEPKPVPEPEPAPPEPAVEASPPAPSTPPAAAISAGAQAFVPHKDAIGIKVGDCLNHIFQVDRFLGRGGMGEVFVGCNVNTDEKVAIKVMLPSLASDEKVIAMFRKEARTLTKLNHPALVQYRVLAQEPNLHVLYIVTDFIEGTNLSVALGKIQPSPAELAGLLRRLASGLAAAHELGAVHRDMSPDNVILEDDDIHDAKIIDFGIAKDLDASSATIVGDGFAGKLNYVAPEQLGDFGREVGPWTDVYSLGLVILAVALGRNVDMSGSLVDAIDKRRKGPDISAIPDNLKPLLQAMLRPDPKERPRSMEAVLEMLDGARIPSPRTVRAEAIAEVPPAPPVQAEAPVEQYEHYEQYEDYEDYESGGGSSKPLLIVLAILLGVAAVLAVIWYLTDGTFGLGGGRDSTETSSAETPSARLARSTIDSVLPQVPCAWLDIGAIRGEAPMTVAMRGVAGNTGAARREIGQALAGARLTNARVEFGDVATILPAGCAAIGAYQQVRDGGQHRMTATEPRYEMAIQTRGANIRRLAANAAIDIDTTGARDFAIVGIQPTGQITPIIASRGDLLGKLAASREGRPISDRGNGRYRLNLDVTHDGWSGLLLLTGTGPFATALVAPPIGGRGPGWRQQFLNVASARNWRAEMVWFESVDRQPERAAGNSA